MNRRDIQKYLARARLGTVEPAMPEGRFRHWIVIPVMNEPEELPLTLQSLAAALPAEDPPGILLVINQPPCTTGSCRENNAELLRQLRGGDIPNVYWIDAASSGREIPGGVGEARRLGMDTAWSLLSTPPGELEHSLLVSLDADTQVAPDYWREITGFFERNPRCGALSIGFRHRPGKTPEEERAIRRYEQYMAQYVQGLRDAGSPYAFYTIGSAIAVRADIYAACGGMRIRAGGEDFYFLQAAAKVAGVGSLERPLVYPAARPSDRVPFGTGPAVRALLAGHALPDYPEAGFDALKALLAHARHGLQHPECWRRTLAPEARQFLETRGFFRIWGKVLQNTPDRDDARLEAFHRWFDGLKTLQFIKLFAPPQSSLSGK